MNKKGNHLIHETSPYLLQHAHNPVDWYPWGPEALRKAKEENKPILVSIGYAACHWCHVMERESFEDEATARIMNEHFINIKIDREERPDLDNIYMDAVQAMTGSGGWPLNVFLTPEGKPFYGGTYFPPVRAYNRSSWQEVLYGMSQAFRERRHEIDAQAENLTEHIATASRFGKKADQEPPSWSKTSLDEIFGALMKTADREWGGFGRAPKFPQTFSICFLLRYHHATGNEDALKQALLSLDKMIEGGIYDQVGGGFARYSTDTEWLAPHFEKMLYDNALLLAVISEAYQLTKFERYREVIGETIAFIRREMMHPGQGFYAALDADSEGVEGKFYVWNRADAEKLLGEDADMVCEYFDITEKGNWEGHSIPRVKKTLNGFAAEKKLEPTRLKQILEKGKQILLKARSERIRPLTDDKIILGWNALMNSACSKAYAATGEEAYRDLAIGNMDFILKHFINPETGRLYHTWKNGAAKFPAFLDDYACLVRALVDLQEVTGDTRWLEKARQLTQQVFDHFDGGDSGFFYYTPDDQVDVIIRKMELYDGAMPSGNAVMAANLWHLSILLDFPEWKKRSLEMTSWPGQAIRRYPGSFGYWAGLVHEQLSGTHEIVLAGNDTSIIHKALLAKYIPHRVLMVSSSGTPSSYPLLAGKTGAEKATIYYCRNYTCQAPVFSVEELMSLINKAQKQ